MERESHLTKKQFSKVKPAEAFKRLGVERLQSWEINTEAIDPSSFFGQRMLRLKRFDLRGSEAAKELIIDAIVEEALANLDELKVWKDAPLSTDSMTGRLDYLIAQDRDYLEAPYFCLIEAKQDDFTQGMAQCLVGMQACDFNNQAVGQTITVYGAVSNGEVWRFYRYEPQGSLPPIVSESVAFTTGNMGQILGIVRSLLTRQR